MKKPTPRTLHTRRVPARPRFRDRLLAEAVRAYERDGAEPIDDPKAAAAARDSGGGLERRIAEHAARLKESEPLASALHGVQQATLLTIVVGLVLAATLGAGAVRAALGGARAEPVNVFWVMASLLGVQTLMLLIWVALALWRPRTLPVSALGSVVVAVGRWLAARTLPKRHALAALRALGATYGRGAAARWSLSAISHAFWVAVNLGCLAILLLVLSAKRYVFNWETTILTAPAFEAITDVLGAAPRAAGFATPTREQVRASEGAASPAVLDETRVAWSGLLVGALAVYGLVPRGVLLALSLALRRHALSRVRLDLTAPGYLRLERTLMPAVERGGVVGEGERPPERRGSTIASPAGAAADDAPGTGPAALIGFEIATPPGGWPPRLHSVRWHDLGLVDSREGQQRVEQELRALTERPCMTVVTCSLTTTPDRGVAAFIERVRAAVSGPLALVLTGGHALRGRSRVEAFEQRLEDWRRLAARAGVSQERVLEVDLEHLTDAETARRLAALVESGDDGHDEAHDDAHEDAHEDAVARRIERAFDLIHRAAEGWSDRPAPQETVKLHDAVARLYREVATRSALFSLPAGSLDEPVRTLTRAGARLTDLLPQRLRSSPRWAVAGALSGVLGCAAVATLVTPVAFAAIPAWSITGAALGAALGLTRGGAAEPPADDTRATPDHAAAVRSATLFALLLELQGRDEVVITRVLDAALAEDPADAALREDRERRVWLDDVRHRLDLALAREGGA